MADCLNPLTLKIDGLDQQVPCGKCTTCRSRQVSSWSFRLMEHYKTCELAHFITLTYADQQATKTSNGYLNLEKRHMQLFFKRLRKSKTGNAKSNISYYAVGEYGGKTKRPHYHAIIFNADIPSIEHAWIHGAVHFGTVNEASVGYTLKYMFKKGQIPQHKNDDRQPEFALMSKGLASVTLRKKC